MCAARIASAARSKAVWKPKLLSIQGMSLSMVLGIPTTPMSRPRLRASFASFWAPRRLPVPADHEQTTLTPCLTSVSIWAPGSVLPREVPSIVPPRLWMPATTASVSTIGSEPSVRPL